MVELRHLRHFVVVAEELHFRKAAIRLHMTQPPLSQSIKKLEESVGTKLLDRSRRSVRLTAAGQAFLAGARGTLRAAEDAYNDAARAAKGLSGRLKVAFVGSAVYDVLPIVLREFRRMHPEVELELLEMTSLEQIDGLTRGNIDIGFLRPPIVGPDPVKQQILQRECLVAAIPETHVLAESPTLELGQLARDIFITFPSLASPNLHSKLLMSCYDAGFTPRIGQNGTQVQTQLGLVAAGLGVALVPHCASRLARQGVVYKELTDPSTHLWTSISIAWHSDRESPLLEKFVRTCTEISLENF
ncbi:LysR family transcriptional regulator [Marinobacter aromaticivorans]|uniref:LysR family transcriptional regulator n=1 Tax=Marinobacter aromaticivorans TaxID=1494078 RepID=A0ABW2J0C8_9GAMM|nr:LysR family transcriptional regulator [Marinobacter aromaticivorans]